MRNGARSRWHEKPISLSCSRDVSAVVTDSMPSHVYVGVHAGNPERPRAAGLSVRYCERPGNDPAVRVAAPDFKCKRDAVRRSGAARSVATIPVHAAAARCTRPVAAQVITDAQSVCAARETGMHEKQDIISCFSRHGSGVGQIGDCRHQVFELHCDNLPFQASCRNAKEPCPTPLTPVTRNVTLPVGDASRDPI